MKAMQVHLKYWKLGSRSGIVQAGKSDTKSIEIENFGYPGACGILKPRLRFGSRIKAV
jgi:hypothetical protein